MNDFRLTLFCTRPDLVREAIASGVDEIIVDWERFGKQERQNGSDTQINRDTTDDLRNVRASTTANVICRVNSPAASSPEEIETAIRHGADEILLPMVRSASEVEEALNRVRGRCAVGILVETNEAVQSAEALARLPLSRVFVGLNDLAIQRGTRNIFTALLDGTVERVRRAFGVPVGFGGITLPDRGYPIPCRLLMAEMARLDCRFSFLRRSFWRDVRRQDLPMEIMRIREALDRACRRTPEEKWRDRKNLEETILAWTQSLETENAASSDRAWGFPNE